jgi:hypothetical protein
MKTVVRIGGATVLAGTIGVGVLAVQADARPHHHTRVIKLRAVFDESSSHATDVSPTGPSAGDTFVYSATLHRGGHVVGRMEGVTTAADNRYQGDVSTQYYVLHRGTIAVVGGGQSGAPGVGRPDDKILDSVVGGTGAYFGARGSVTVRDLSPSTELITLRLR